MKADRLLLFLFITIQVVGFSLLWSKLPGQGELATTPNQLSVDILAKLDVLTKQEALIPGQQPVSTSDGLAMVSYPEAETFRNAIRDILKEELAIALENQTLVASAAIEQSKSNIERPLTPEQAEQRQTAMTASRSIIEQAISEGEWNNEDVSAMEPYVKSLSNSQREELIELYLQGIGVEAMSEGVPPPPL
jgi:hypothetical protein